MYIVGFNISVSWKFWQPEVNSQCLAMASREHGAVEVDVAVAGGVPGEIFLSCYNTVPQYLMHCGSIDSLEALRLTIKELQKDFTTTFLAVSLF